MKDLYLICGKNTSSSEIKLNSVVYPLFFFILHRLLTLHFKGAHVRHSAPLDVTLERQHLRPKQMCNPKVGKKKKESSPLTDSSQIGGADQI